MFGLGTSLLYSIFNQATDLDDITQAQLEERINQLQCSASEQVCISGNRAEVKRGDLAVFGVYIYNLKTATTSYVVKVDKLGENNQPMSIRQDKTLMLESDIKIEILGSGRYERTLEANEQGSVAIGVNVPRDTISGTYVLDVSVYPAGEVDQRIKRKLFLTVK